ncbi:MAG: HEAT repeat domain-containing protein [Pirellulales bacterium]|nr:HEAT repeat domain-containing protein [Pirellulales bacterium]
MPDWVHARSLSQWAELLQSPQKEERFKAIEALLCLYRSDPEIDTTPLGFSPELDTDCDLMLDVMRWQSMGVLLLYGQPKKPVVPKLIDLLQDPVALFRVTAAEALWMIEKNPKAIPVLQDALADKEPSIADLAAMILKKVGPQARGAVPGLLKLLNDQEEKTRRHVVETLGAIGADTPEVIDALTMACRDKYKSVRAAAAEALGAFGPSAKPAESTLMKMLRDHQGSVRVAAAEALWQIGRHPWALSALIAELNNDFMTASKRPYNPQAPQDDFYEDIATEDPFTIQYLSAEALKRIGPPGKAVIPDLQQIRNQSHRPAHIFAASALGKIDPQQSPLPTLVAGLKNDRYLIRKEAARELRELGPEAKSAVPDLVAALRRFAVEDSQIDPKTTLHDFSPGNLANSYHSLHQAWKMTEEALKTIDPQAAQAAGVGEESKAFLKRHAPQQPNWKNNPPTMQVPPSLEKAK